MDTADTQRKQAAVDLIDGAMKNIDGCPYIARSLDALQRAGNGADITKEALQDLLTTVFPVFVHALEEGRLTATDENTEGATRLFTAALYCLVRQRHAHQTGEVMH